MRAPPRRSRVASPLARFVQQHARDAKCANDVVRFSRLCGDLERRDEVRKELTELHQLVEWMSGLHGKDSLCRSFAAHLLQTLFPPSEEDAAICCRNVTWPLLRREYVVQLPSELVQHELLGMREADALALANGWWAEGDALRTCAMFEHACAKLIREEGSSCMTAGALAEASAPVAAGAIEREIARRVRCGGVLEVTIRGVRRYTPRANFESERALAAYILQQAGEARDIYEARLADAIATLGVTPSDEQLRAARTVLASGISVVTGPGGAGKTSVVARLVCEYARGMGRVVCLAPTHSARQTLAEGLALSPDDVHIVQAAVRLRKELEEGGQSVLVVVDETSMVGASDMCVLARLLRGVRHRVVFLGDEQQLASVSWGQPLVDMVESGRVPVARLTHCYRAESRELARFCELVRPVDGNVYWTFDAARPNYVLRGIGAVHATFCEAERVVPTLRETLLALRQRGAQEEDVTVLTWSNGDAAEYAQVHRQVFRPECVVGDARYATGELVLIRVNYAALLKNNDVVTVEELHGSTVTVRAGAASAAELDRFREEHRHVRVTAHAAYTLLTIPLAHIVPRTSITVHRSQGRGIRHVVYARSKGAMCDVGRLNYTAYTRAKESIHIIGSRQYFGGLRAKRPGFERCTLLPLLLAGEGAAHGTVGDATPEDTDAFASLEARVREWRAHFGAQRGGACAACASRIEIATFLVDARGPVCDACGIA